MKIFSKINFLVGILLITLLSSCTQLSNTELLTSDTWRLTSLSSDDVDPDLLNLTRVFFALAEFDYLDDGTYTISFSDSSLTADGGTWRFNEDETQLITQETGEPEQVSDIVNLDEETLEYNLTDATGTYNFVFGHQ